MKYGLLLLTLISVTAQAKYVDPVNPQVAEFLRAENSTHLVLGGVEIETPQVEGALIEWSPFLITNKKSADLICKLMGYGESFENHGTAMNLAEAIARSICKLGGTEIGFIEITDAQTHFYFDKVRCKGI